MQLQCYSGRCNAVTAGVSVCIVVCFETFAAMKSGNEECNTNAQEWNLLVRSPSI